NNIAMPQPSVVFINTIVSGGGSLANVRHDYYQNRATTTLGGTTAIGINSNAETSNFNLGRWGEPVQIGRGDAYIWKHTSINKLYVKYGSKPTAEGDGVILGEDAYIKGTMAFPGITVNAGSYAKADINVSGMGMDLSRFIQLAPDVELGIDAGTGYLNWSYHYFNNGGTPTLRIVFQNPTATGVTLAAGTWKYRVMLN
ncbi:MAG: hypothetical protein HY954_13320, partial [Deltaproteobacteria bacterium]|nr:hypothetical protein [Deltaproteobacteria bacterium]